MGKRERNWCERTHSHIGYSECGGRDFLAVTPRGSLRVKAVHKRIRPEKAGCHLYTAVCSSISAELNGVANIPAPNPLAVWTEVEHLDPARPHDGAPNRRPLIVNS